VLLWLAGLLVGRGAVADEHSEVVRLLSQASSQANYLAPTSAQLAQCEDLFVRTLQGPRDALLAGQWQQLGWDVIELQQAGQALWIIYEPPPNARGWGLYAIRPNQLPGIVLQAPHSFSDTHTRRLALQLFSEGPIAACAWNTVHRDTVDVAHTSDHPFSSFTRALVRCYPACYLVQLHGFATENRRSPAGAVAGMVISNGDDYPDLCVRKTAALMQAAFPNQQVQLYPTQIRELGGTTNVQGEILRHHDSEAFIHFEFSRALRRQLVTDRAARDLFLKNLSAAVE
jgi:hypothetical protein